MSMLQRCINLSIGFQLLLFPVLGYGYCDYGCGDIISTNLNTSREIGDYEFAAAGFGSGLDTSSNLKGVLHQASPKDGCGPMEPPPPSHLLPPNMVWIAVIIRSEPGSRNTCEFIDKVYHSQQSGYRAAIIYNFAGTEDDGLIPMGSNDAKLRKMVNIPSAFVSYQAGMDMRAHSYHGPPSDLTSAEFKLSDYGFLNPYKILIPMAFSFIGILLVAIIIMIVRWCQTINKRRRSRISKSQLKKIPLVKYKKDDQYDCCAICLDDYEEGEKVRLLPCSHTYHRKCIDPWLLKNKRTCPVCKRKVIPKPARRQRQRRASDTTESDDSDAGHTTNERAPLLPPPLGRRERRGGTRETVAEYGAAGESRPMPVDCDTDSPRQESEAPSHEGLSDEEADLRIRRTGLFPGISVAPESGSGGEHSLHSFPRENGLSGFRGEDLVPVHRAPPPGDSSEPSAQPDSDDPPAPDTHTVIDMGNPFAADSEVTTNQNSETSSTNQNIIV